jgi:uncharacterized membrane protein (DUF373 family)
MLATERKTQIGRLWIARAFTIVEDIVYIGLAALLATSAFALLARGTYAVITSIANGTFASNIIPLLDQILLILLVVELLYTVQVSIREHTIVPEPFLLVGVIAVIRRVLVVTAEFAHVQQMTEVTFRHFATELAVLTVLVLVLVISLLLLRKYVPVAQERPV